MVLKEGEKYLTVEILGGLKVNCFPNPDSEKNPKAPHFKGSGLAVWVNKKQAPKTKQEDAVI